MFELCQAPTVERYLHDLLQYALGVLQIVTLVPSSQKMIVNATLSTNQSGIYVILDAANISNSHVDPEIIQSALNVLITLVCPLLQSAINHLHCHKASSLRLPKPLMVLSLRLEIDMPTDLLKVPAILILGTLCRPCHTAEQGYHQAREAVCSSNGIKVLIQIISSRVCSSPGALDCLRALACRVLLGLARDDNIPHTLTKLQGWKW
ncbi:DDB1- and CUL4-associated factor homolog 1-like isoform X2 [Vicia villosa]|uniref:DDB1- and CUL4-associated factor homolog 1-like isoform X2 n=1 Tax=Vicia villosa TaxID=3911 RepID=UPI00273B90A6|nr:DDB1- and CUL4-associated factor homolog 1-like isoform X2 [Vicia villosa]